MHDDLPKTRKAAIDANIGKYFTGEPCGRGHIAPRYALNSLCMECNAEDRRRGRKARSFSSGNSEVIQTTVTIRKADLQALFAFIGSLDSARVTDVRANAEAAVDLERIHGATVARQLEAAHR